MQLLLAMAVLVAPFVLNASSVTSERSKMLMMIQREVELADDVTSQARQVGSKQECALACVKHHRDCKILSVCTEQAGK